MTATVETVRRINLDFRLKNIPCRQACPVHTDAGMYVNAIAEGRFEEAAERIFPTACRKNAERFSCALVGLEEP
ncbi:MAG: hypothetical protein IIB13_05365 [Chloroflexi bacterium]|nr:hypothetical protein [Chloroflexota bacterium]